MLRGVNVGGKHRVPKVEFQRVLKELGYSDITIYINSGNAVFTSNHNPKASEVQAALEGSFGFSIPTLLLSAEKVQNIAKSIPAEWTNDSPKPDKSGQKSDVLYLFDGINTPDILNKLRYQPDIETMIYVDGAVITNISRANQMKGSLGRLVGSKLYSQMTIRNIKTAKKLAELV